MRGGRIFAIILVKSSVKADSLRMKTIILNGWAASERAWELCDCAKGPDARIVSYLEQMDGVAERVLDEAGKAVVVGWSMGGLYNPFPPVHFPRIASGWHAFPLYPRNVLLAARSF